jgi:actin-related protein
MSTHPPTIVIDSGSGKIKAGFANEENPSILFSNIIGRPRHRGLMIPNIPTIVIGDDAQSKRGLLTITSPIRHGEITKWEDIVEVWRYTFQLLGDNQQNLPVLLTESPTNSLQNREKMAQVMFEEFGIPSLCIKMDATLTLTATGRSTGVVLDSGYNVTHFVPIYNGIPIKDAIQRWNVGGEQVNQSLSIIFSEKPYCYSFTVSQRPLVDDIKEKHCFVSVDFDKGDVSEEWSKLQVEYPLGNGNSWYLDRVRYTATEPMFTPMENRYRNYSRIQDYGIPEEPKGINEYLYNSVMLCDGQIREELFQNVVLAGGNTMFDGFAERICHDLRGKAEINITAFEDRKYLACKGGCILARQDDFKDHCITKQEYEEQGSL